MGEEKFGLNFKEIVECSCFDKISKETGIAGIKYTYRSFETCLLNNQTEIQDDEDSLMIMKELQGKLG